MDRFLWLKHPRRTQAVAVVDDFWHFRYVENPGAAFGFLANEEAWLRLPLFIGITIVAPIFIGWMFRETRPEQRLMRFTLGIILGGAIGNFIDRIRLGYVIDFIDWHLRPAYGWTFPTFNIADSAVVCGGALILIFGGQTAAEDSDAPPEEEPPAAVAGPGPEAALAQAAVPAQDRGSRCCWRCRRHPR